MPNELLHKRDLGFLNSLSFGARTACILMPVAALSCLHNSVLTAAEVSVVDLFRTVGAQYKSEIEAVETLQGSATITEILPAYMLAKQIEAITDEDVAAAIEDLFAHDYVLRRRSVAATFAVDLIRDNLYSSFQQTGNTIFYGSTTKKAVECAPAHPIHRDTVVTSDKTLTVRQNRATSAAHMLFPEIRKGTKPYHLMYVEAADVGKDLSYAADVFDPRRLLDCFGWKIPDLLNSCAQQIAAGEISVESAGDVEDDNGRSITWGRGTKSKVERRLCFKAGSEGDVYIVSATLTASSGEVDGFEWDFSSVNAAALPARWTHRQVDAEGRIVNERRVEFDKLLVNEPIADEMFTEKVFGLSDGDRVVDRFANKGSVLHNGEFIEPASYAQVAGMSVESSALARRRGNGWRYVFIVANLICAGALLCGWVLRDRLKNWKEQLASAFSGTK